MEKCRGYKDVCKLPGTLNILLHFKSVKMLHSEKKKKYSFFMQSLLQPQALNITTIQFLSRQEPQLGPQSTARSLWREDLGEENLQ